MWQDSYRNHIEKGTDDISSVPFCLTTASHVTETFHNDLIN